MNSNKKSLPNGIFYLAMSSLIMAFSIPLNKRFLAKFNPFAISAVFCISSAIVFIPFTKFNGLKLKDAFKLCTIGFVQFGLMYSLFQASFFFLQGHEVALLLISTPVYLVAIDSAFKKKWSNRNFVIAIITALLALFLADFSQKFSPLWSGIVLTQSCNICFALGQILIKRFCTRRGMTNPLSFNFLLYLGAAVACIPCAIFFQSNLMYCPLTTSGFAIASMFGIICCGVSHWLWNLGAVNTNVQSLAVMNNLQIPLAMLITCLIFGEKIDLARFFSVTLIMGIMMSLLALCKNGADE